MAANTKESIIYCIITNSILWISNFKQEFQMKDGALQVLIVMFEPFCVDSQAQNSIISESVININSLLLL